MRGIAGVFGTRRTRWAALVLMAVVVAGVAYSLQNRYFLRFVPLPLALLDLPYGDTSLFPSSQSHRINGAVFFPTYDLTTEQGLRQTLDEIQGVSPFIASASDHPPTEFSGWAAWLRKNPFYCTDATQLFVLAAGAQNIAAREWQLLMPGWPPGAGHSIVEFHNPATRRWQAVDAQHAAILREADGQPASMSYVLRRFSSSRIEDIRIDYGRFESIMKQGGRGASVEEYLFNLGLLNTPVLQLRQPTWFATVDGIGHPVIGYPIIVNGWTHDHRIWTTKVALILASLAVLALVRLAKRSRLPSARGDR